jgi:hypothetical protein
MNSKTFVLRNVRFLQKNSNKSLFNATKDTNYEELIDFESQICTVSHITSSVVLRKNIEIDLRFMKVDDGGSFSFEENKLYSLILEAYKYCKKSNKIVYIMRQINEHEIPDKYEENDSDVESEDDITDVECMHNIYDDLRTSLDNLLKIKNEEVLKITNILKETENNISIKSVNQMNNMLETIS